MTVMTVNFGKPIKTHNYLERVVTLLFLLWTTTTTITVSLLTGSVGWYWFLNVVSHQVKLSASHSRIWRRLWKYSRLVLAGMHHQSKLDPRKTSASLCWMGREFLANVKNIWKDLRNINIKQWAELSVCWTGWTGWLVLCVFNIYVVLPIITTSFSFFRTNIFSGCSRCSFMVGCVLIEKGNPTGVKTSGGGEVGEGASYTQPAILLQPSLSYSNTLILQTLGLLASYNVQCSPRPDSAVPWHQDWQYTIYFESDC